MKSIYLIRTHNGMAHINYLIAAQSFGEAEGLFKKKMPYQGIDSIEITADVVEIQLSLGFERRGMGNCHTGFRSHNCGIHPLI